METNDKDDACDCCAKEEILNLICLVQGMARFGTMKRRDARRIMYCLHYVRINGYDPALDQAFKVLKSPSVVDVFAELAEEGDV